MHKGGSDSVPRYKEISGVQCCSHGAYTGARVSRGSLGADTVAGTAKKSTSLLYSLTKGSMRTTDLLGQRCFIQIDMVRCLFSTTSKSTLI